MRRKIMTAFVCAIMTMSVVPVYADDTTTNTAKTQEEVTTTAQPATQVTTAVKKKTNQQTKKNQKKTSEKKKDSKDQTSKEDKYMPMPTKIISKSSSDTIQNRISKKQDKISKLNKQETDLKKQIQREEKKSKMIKDFYKKYTSHSKAAIALYGQEITPAMKVSKKDEEMRDDLYKLADLLGDKKLKKSAGTYVFGINHPDFETLLDKNDEFDLDQYLKNVTILPTKPMEQKLHKITKQIKNLKKDLKKESGTRYFNPNDVSELSHITVDDARHMLQGTALSTEAETYVKAEEKYHVNAVFLMAIAAHESAWGTSRRAREDNNLTGYGVTSDRAKGINKSTKEEGLLLTAKTLHEKYLTPGGSYYTGTSVEAVNAHYCVGNEWAYCVTINAYQLMNQL